MLRRFFGGTRARLRSIGPLGRALVYTGIVGLVLPGVLFLVQDDEFGPEESREHIASSLEKVRQVRDVFQQVENKLEEAESKTRPSNDPLTGEERRAIEQLMSGGGSKWGELASLEFLEVLFACAFFLIAGIAIERHYLAPRRAAPPPPPPPPPPGAGDGAGRRVDAVEGSKG